VPGATRSIRLARVSRESVASTLFLGVWPPGVHSRLSSSSRSDPPVHSALAGPWPMMCNTASASGGLLTTRSRPVWEAVAVDVPVSVIGRSPSSTSSLLTRSALWLISPRSCAISRSTASRSTVLASNSNGSDTFTSNRSMNVATSNDWRQTRWVCYAGGVPFSLAHRAAAALRADAERSSADIFSARTRPPLNPPFRPNATAAGSLPASGSKGSASPVASSTSRFPSSLTSRGLRDRSGIPGNGT
jgi:hypothetical protein